MKEYRRLLKCSTCGNVGECTYIGSRNVNERGEVSDIVGSKEMWISYFRCPSCGAIEVVSPGREQARHSSGAL